MKKIHQIPLIIAIFAIGICISCFNSDVACAADGPIHEANPEPMGALTAQERAWLKAHPIIRLAYPPGHEPTLMEDEEGKLIGVLADYFGLINQRLKTNISLTLVPWIAVDEKIRNKEIEGLVAATSSKLEALGLLPTQRKFSSYVVVYGQGQADSLDFPDDLHGRRVAVLSGYYHTDYAVDQIRDKAKIIPVKSPREGLELVHQSRVDFFIGSISNNYLVSKYQLFGIGALHVFWDQPYRAGPAARSDLPELAAILEKGADLITDEEFDTIIAKWTKVKRSEPQVELTPDERQWLAAHPDIELGYTDAFEPGIIVSEDGSYRGAYVDILKLLNQRLGTNFKPTVDSIAELIRRVNDKELAGVLAIHSDRADKLGWLKTTSFMNIYPTIFTRKGFSFAGFSDLAGKRIALIDKVFFSQNLVDLYGAGSELVKVQDGREGLETVRNDNADIYIGSSGNSYLLSKYQFYDLIAAFQFYSHPVPSVMGIRNDWPRLVSILNKGFDSISPEEIESILLKWGYDSEMAQVLPLTTEEQAWLKDNPRIGVGVSPIPPYMFSENTRVKGYLIDIMELLVNQVGLAADYSIKPIDENLSGVKSGAIHTILGMIHNEERAGFMYFSENVMNMQMAVFAGTSRSDISDAASLEGKVIASFKGYGFEPVIKKFFPNATIIQADDTAGMLRLVASGEADAAVQELYSGEYILRDSFINGVARKGSFAPPGLPLMTGSEFGVSKKYPLLNSILNKAYDALPESEKNRVWRKWFADDTAEKELVELTDNEQRFLEEYPTLRFGFMVGYDPYFMIDETGRQNGILVDLGEELSRKLGIDIEIEGFKTIPDLLEASEKKAIDVVYTILPERAEKRGLLSTDIFLHSYVSIYTRDGERVTTPDDMIGKSVALSKDATYTKLLVEPFLEKITVVSVDTPADGLRMLAEGKVEMYVGSSTHSFLLYKYRIGGVSQAYIYTEEGRPFVMGIRPDRPELVSILNKGLSSIGEQGIDDIVVRWLRAPKREEVIKLSTEERAWLAQNNTVRVFSTDHAPLLFYKGNKPFGIAVDLLSEVSTLTGIKFDITKPLRDFPSALKGLIENEGPDLMAALNPTPEREKVILFTKSYVTSPKFIFTRDDAPFISSMASLSGKTVAVIGGYVTHKLLDKNHPDINLLIYKNSEAALRAVSSGEAFAFIGSMLATSSMINEFGLTNIKASAPSALPEATVAMGIRNDWTELRDIINKAFDAIPEREKFAIINKWSSVKIDYGIKPAELIKWSLLVVGGGFGTILFFVFWNRALAMRVRKRTIELESTTESLKTEIAERNQTEAALKTSRRFTDNLIETANVMIVGLDAGGNINIFNPAAERTSGYTISELHGKNWFEILVPKERYPQVHQEFTRVLAGGLPKSFQNPILTKSGEERVISWSSNEIKTGDQITGTLSFGIDVTKVKQAEQKLQQYQQQLKALASQLTIAEEQERRRIAADLHDQIGQTLALARFQLAAIGKSVSEVELTDQINELSGSMRQAARDAQHLIFDLSSPSLNEIGLPAAISEWLEETIAKRYGLKTEFIEKGREKSLNLDERAILFRSVRELLINVIKHARASKVSVFIEYTETSLMINVRDDGLGFDPSLVTETGAAEKGFGLFSIQERMNHFGGYFEIETKPGQGCEATLAVPIDVISSEERG